jgi:magnesium chelatase accessory protein
MISPDPSPGLQSWAAPLQWTQERGCWPNAGSSRFLRAGGLGWHVQQMGAGPELLLIHGTGASTHSWRGLAPLLARSFTVIAPDLPGHGFSERVAKRPLSLPLLAESVSALVRALELRPRLVIGHSAGAAILIRCVLDGLLTPRGLVGINAALLPFRGAAGFLFPPLARLMFLNPLAPGLLARSARNRDRVERLIRDTGSELDPEGVDFYARLFRSTAQVASVLSMMAHWDLRTLERELPSLQLPLLLLAGSKDRAIAPGEADRVSRSVAGSRAEQLPGLGHLAHEEDSARVAGRIEAFAEQLGG